MEIDILTKDGVAEVAAKIDAPVEFIGQCRDTTNPFDEGGNVSFYGFVTPEEAWKRVRTYALSTGYTCLDYWVYARIGDTVVKSIFGFKGTT